MVQKDGERDQVHDDEMTMADLFEQSLAARQPVVKGTIIKGTLITIRPSELLVDIGSKYEGIIRAKDFDRVDPHMGVCLATGSGKEAKLPSPPPLRTARTSFPVSGSSLSNAR
jgi:hypothetical protein